MIFVIPTANHGENNDSTVCSKRITGPSGNPGWFAGAMLQVGVGGRDLWRSRKLHELNHALAVPMGGGPHPPTAVRLVIFRIGISVSVNHGVSRFKQRAALIGESVNRVPCLRL